MPDYKKEWSDVVVNYLIISTSDYIVCLDDEHDVDWKTTDEYDKKGHEDEIRFNETLNYVALLECRPQHHFDIEQKKNFRRMLGESVARSLAHDYKNADLMLKQAEEYLLDRSREKSREWYLVAGGLTTFISSIVILVLIVFQEKIQQLFNINESFFFISMLAGCLGSFLSITLRLGDSKVQADSGQYLHTLEAISRVVAGCIGGVLSGILIKTGIVMPSVSEETFYPLALFAIGFVAGASERFIPAFISKVENKESSYE